MKGYYIMIYLGDFMEQNDFRDILIVSLAYFIGKFLIKAKDRKIYRAEIVKHAKLISVAIIASTVCYGLFDVEKLNQITLLVKENWVFFMLAITIPYSIERFYYKKRTKNSNKFFIVLMFMYLFLTIFNNEDILLKIILIELIYMLSFLSLERVSNDDSKKREKTKLYKIRENKLENIKTIIKTINISNYCIAINGEWGSGKSQVINNLLIDLEEDNYIIHIKPMINETKESLLKEFKNNIFSIMKKAGIYHSKNNSLEGYYQRILELINIDDNISLGTLININKNNQTYKESKLELQKDIDILLGLNEEKYEKHLIVIIDDFDRVEEDNQRQIISFIKEIIDFSGCIILVALDYKIIDNKNKDVDSNYLEKFIDCRVDIGMVDFEYIIDFHWKDRLKSCTDFVSKTKNEQCKVLTNDIINTLNENKIIYKNEFDSKIRHHLNCLDKEIKDILNEKKEGYNDKLLKLYDEKNILHSYYTETNKSLNNSRGVIHMLDEIGVVLLAVSQLIQGFSEQVLQQIEKINLSKMIYLFSYLKTFFKDDYNILISSKDLNWWLFQYGVNNQEYKGKYFEIMFGDFINTSSSSMSDKDELISINSRIFFTEALINGDLNEERIGIYTREELILNQIDNNKISFNSQYDINIIQYINLVNRSGKVEELKIERHKKIAKYICKLFNKKIISDAIVANVLFGKTINFKYLSYYIDVLIKDIEEDSLEYLLFGSSFDYGFKNIEFENCCEYLQSINKLVLMYFISKGKTLETNSIYKHTIEDMTYFLINIFIENGMKDTVINKKLHEIVAMMYEEIKASRVDFEFFNIDLISEDIDTYLRNSNSIMKLKHIKENKKNNHDKFLNFIRDYNDAIEALKDLQEKNHKNKNVIKVIMYSLDRIISESKNKEKNVEFTDNISKEDIELSLDIVRKFNDERVKENENESSKERWNRILIMAEELKLTLSDMYK